MDPSVSPVDNSIQPHKRSSITGWGPVSAIIVTVGIYFVSQLVAGFVIAIFPLIRGWNGRQINDWLQASVYGQFFFILLVEAITLSLLWLFLRHRKIQLKTIGLKKPKLRDIGYALSGFAVYILIYIVSLTVIQHFIPGLNTNQKQELGFSTSVSGLPLLLTFISLVLLPPFVEEIMTRGFLYTGLRKKLPKIIAAIITSVMFAAAHLQAGNGKALLWAAAIDTFVLSMVLVYLRQKTDSLAAPMMLHAMKNCIAFVTLFVLHYK